MKKGSLVVLIKKPMSVDFEIAKRHGINLPNFQSVYTLSTDPYISSVMGVEKEVIKLEENGSTEFNKSYFQEVQRPTEGNNIINSLTEQLCKKAVS